MAGGGLYRKAVRLMPEAVRGVCKQAGVEVDEIGLVVAHPANERILEGVRRQLGLAVGEGSLQHRFLRQYNVGDSPDSLPRVKECREGEGWHPGLLHCFWSRF